MKGAFTSELSPVAYFGQPVILDDGTEQAAFRVGQVAPLVGVETESVTVGANDQTSPQKAEELEIWDGWLAQYRPTNLTQDLPDGIEVEVYQGANNQPLYQSRNGQGRWTNSNVYELTDTGSGVDVATLSNFAEVYVFEDEPPRFKYTNTTGSSEDITLQFTGFSFNLEPITGAKADVKDGGLTDADFDGQPVYVPVEGIRGGA